MRLLWSDIIWHFPAFISESAHKVFHRSCTVSFVTKHCPAWDGQEAAVQPFISHHGSTLDEKVRIIVGEIIITVQIIIIISVIIIIVLVIIVVEIIMITLIIPAQNKVWCEVNTSLVLLSVNWVLEYNILSKHFTESFSCDFDFN